MKVIKDAMMKWLDEEIDKLDNPFITQWQAERLGVLKQVKTKLTEIIVEEFHKLSEEKEDLDA